ncbi:MAG: hypothetical protein M0R30_07570 [Methanoregula sp.]|jgi:hypothetical protein|uniref:hypothetical protein n=1 Tax=Methanoregula sp. TaxID=2052170 RepID=UPI0025DEC21A|nr:hypothetical protein [Methanoregula sp.]MCK9631487.1 hypothetical protein [Methanoregula sp.]
MRNYFFLLLLLTFLVLPVSADGMAFKGLEDRWSLQPETMQLAAINYENGYENLLLSVTLENSIRGNKTVWIFPVPAQPEQIEIDMVRGYPRFGGKNLDRVTGDSVGTIALSSAAYGTFPASLPLWVMGGAGFFTLQKAQAADGNPAGFVVHERIEKMGIVTELVTARDGASVRDYVTQNGVVLPQEAEGLLNEYIGKDYSFVISYAGNTTGSASLAGLEEKSPGTPPDVIGVFVRFPADRIYFPLRPTSIYGKQVIPVVIDVTGFVTPLPDDKIRPVTEVSYFVDENFWYYYSAGELGKFFNYPTEFRPVTYTRVRITAPSEYFTSDLMMESVPPAGVRVKETLIQYAVFWAVPLYILVSVLVSLVAGTIVFGRTPANPKILALHGLWNCGTMVGFACGTAQFLKIEGASGKKRLGFFVLFYLLFIAVYTLAAAIASPALAHGLVNLFTFLLILPVIGFMFGMYIFARDPVLAIILFTLNAGFYGVLWLAVKKYLN